MQIKDSKQTYMDLMKPGSFIGSTLVASGIKNALIIFHGIAGCNIEAVHFRSDQIPGGNYVPIIPTGLNESDCIQGGMDKLLKTLRDTIGQSIAKKRPPEIVFILTSDATSIVGDDIQTAARVVEEETGVKIIALDTPGFAGGLVHGTDAALSALIKNQAPSNSQSGINIIAPHLLGSKNWVNDADEIIRLMQEAEIPVNLNLARNLNYKELEKFTNSRTNYILSGEKLDNFEKHSNNLNIETLNINLPLPIGIANTEKWLLTLAEEFGDVEKAKILLENEQKLINKQLKYNYNFSWMSTLMYGKYASILAHAKFGASLARSLYWDFGIIPKVIGLIAETDRAMGEAIELLEPLEGNVEFTVLKNPSYFDYGNLIKEAQVDFAIGAIHDKPLCIGHKIPHLSLAGFNFFNQYNFIPWPNFGVRGTLGLLTELSRVMEDAFYLKDMIATYNYNPDKSEGTNNASCNIQRTQ
ncbi:MAG: hypothetical protein A2287_03640 [Candidatus Melainabacteria bacterium RIFOXYA12_FULL_32_12]|nr:MAG: hypothetical protein A2255_05935 [Candidatus Melainabacteria bacterium RIFOXYA2_FULL_32_9]OGI24171.1 MAG: hypothetical protein A2287_03640 [Candidatus Melainabacteria bacterium RIFOXYA12_FULL_32_12]